MRHINAAAAVTPINLLAITLLATPRLALPKTDLLRQMDLYRELLRGFSYSDRVTVTSMSAAEILAYGQSMKVVSVQPHPLGDIVRMSDESAVLATYYRNNILHLFAMPSLVACAFVSNATVRTEDIQRLAWRIYPYIAAELFLRWNEEELPTVVMQVLACLEQQGSDRIRRRPDGVAPAAAEFRARPCNCRCWRRRPYRPSSVTTWPSRAAQGRQRPDHAGRAGGALSAHWHSAWPCCMV